MTALPYRVLVVEGQPFQCEYLLNLFREHGVTHLDSAHDGAEAMRCLEQDDYDLILSDLLMPGMDGVQLIQQLSGLEHPPPLALMSSASRRLMGSARRVAQALGVSVIDMIPKPALPAAIHRLLDRLGRHLRQHSPACAPRETHFTRERLLQALEQDELQTWFQPRASLRRGRIVAAEALVRWVHPQLGVLLPGRFMPDVAAHELHEPLLRHVLEQTLRSQATWREQGLEVPVSVNLPTHLLDDPTLPDRLYQQLIEQHAVPASICFELTEESTTAPRASYYAGACRLRMKGFGLAQDDFGQGYSSLCNLVSTPFSVLKIDRALVHGCAEDGDLAAALTSMITLGRRLGLEVVAEGVETREELQLLRRLGCDRIQGFLIAPAVPAAVLQGMLQQGRPAVLH